MFCFCQYIHGKKTHEIVGDMNLLLSLAAGLVGGFYINRLDKLSESVRGMALAIKGNEEQQAQQMYAHSAIFAKIRFADFAKNLKSSICSLRCDHL